MNYTITLSVSNHLPYELEELFNSVVMSGDYGAFTMFLQMENPDSLEELDGITTRLEQLGCEFINGVRGVMHPQWAIQEI